MFPKFGQIELEGILNCLLNVYLPDHLTSYQTVVYPLYIDPILDGVRVHPILDGGKPSQVTSAIWCLTQQ